jgi:hypothetical protein
MTLSQTIKINKGKFTPEVLFDLQRGTLALSGNSFPENSTDFYVPLLKQLDQYLAIYTGRNLVIDFDFNYVNSSSSKFIYQLFDILDRYHHAGKTVKVTWHYDKDDLEILELGQALAQTFNLPVYYSINIY